MWQEHAFYASQSFYPRKWTLCAHRFSPCPSTNIRKTPKSLNTTAIVSEESRSKTVSRTPAINNAGLFLAAIQKQTQIISATLMNDDILFEAIHSST